MENDKENGKEPFKCENRVTLAGRLTKDPIISGDAVKRAFFGLAVERRYKKGDEWADETSFIPVVTWRSVAEKVAKLGKGSAVRIEGTLRTKRIPQEGKTETKEVWEVSAFKLEVVTAKSPGREKGELAGTK